MADSKLLSLTEAIERFVPDGSSVALGTAQETLIPFAASREMMRQRKRNLVLIGPISDIQYDQLVGAGCVARIRAAWAGNVITGSGYNFRRAVESGEVAMEDHSNLTISMALRAGAMGVTFMPARTALGSDLYRTNGSLKEMACPFTGETLTAVAAINPDVAIIHVQRSDKFGNAHCWGNLGITREACLAARHIVITAEEIVEPEVISSDPNRVVTPGFRVNAVVHAPWGAHPSPVPGHYNRDHQFFLDYQEESRTPELFAAWQVKWVDGVSSSEDYIDRRFVHAERECFMVDGVSSSEDYIDLLGEERVAALRVKRPAKTAVADYGY